MASIWLEAEAFDRLGGWVVDTQSMERIGSAYVMAHGMGIPVADAETVCRVPQAGEWTVWARTRDWTAPWKRGTPAGRFQVGLDGALLPGILGTNGEEWGWQRAGAATLAAGETRVSLHDLTGFNGRCDALCLTTDAAAPPPDEPAALAAFRRQMAGVEVEDDPAQYDLAVAGGGIAGICAAVAALRTGSRVLLVQDRAVLGGCNSSEVRVGLGGFAHAEPYPNLGNVVTEIAPVFGGSGTYDGEAYEDSRKAGIFRLQRPDSYRLALNERVVAVERSPEDPNRIAAIVTRHARTGAERRYRARLFADCTGDAVLARLMGAETMYGREARAVFGESLAPERANRQVMGMSVQWYARRNPEPCGFPDIDWGIPFTEETAYYIRGGDWEWETGQWRDQAEDAEYVRDYGMMALYANWSYLKNHARRKDEWAHDRLAWVSPVGGKRESYRVVGDHVLTQRDIEERIAHPDASATMTWNLDLHFPDPENEAKFAEPFRSCAYHRGIVEPYPVPYRCLYARDVPNLFLGGRHISASHVAFSCVRVMRTLGSLGEVVGLAASICRERQCLPRDVYGEHLDELRAAMARGVPVPTYHAYGCDTSESYHFKELGFVRIGPGHENAAPLAPGLVARIRALAVSHIYRHPSFPETEQP